MGTEYEAQLRKYLNDWRTRALKMAVLIEDMRSLMRNANATKEDIAAMEKRIDELFT